MSCSKIPFPLYNQPTKSLILTHVTESFHSLKGRAQIYPDGSKSNNTVYAASVTGKINIYYQGQAY